ncbi:DUF6364 family protein [Galbibacter sp. EGI 63066]|uniref:DUF6364 family protein n=1 Tax=Galbibacter sp. EGI 63066 TaxID=2993559 RepID=UPI002248F52D|nr:DUF6364 family protein [Galbibacter sp. EGI 63066]MCX2680856.1 DUF6364 family protein [Galbibacter sp. EGI 63066]
MDAKVTLSFDKQVIERAKAYAAEHNISLSRLTEFIFKQITSEQYQTLEDMPISDWVHSVAEGEVEYQKTPSRKQMKSEFLNSRK